VNSRYHGRLPLQAASAVTSSTATNALNIILLHIAARNLAAVAERYRRLARYRFCQV